MPSTADDLETTAIKASDLFHPDQLDVMSYRRIFRNFMQEVLDFIMLS